MSTPWPRFEVFKQDKPNQPHQSVGTVHAADAELALLNARDVFVRRPSCHSLWVVPDQAIYAVTAEALASEATQQTLARARATQNTQQQFFLVFQKKSQRQAMAFVAHVGQVEAYSPQQALALALETFDTRDVFVWWVCPAAAVTRSDPELTDSWFAPADTKIYRQQSYYGKVARQSRSERSQIVQQLSRSHEGEA